MKKVLNYDNNSRIEFEFQPGGPLVWANLYTPHDALIPAARVSFEFGNLRQSDFAYLIDVMDIPDQRKDSEVRGLMLEANNILHWGCIEENYKDYGVEQLLFRHFNSAGLNYAEIVREGIVVKSFAFLDKGLGLKEAKDLVESLLPINQDGAKIDQIRYLRQASSKFLDDIALLSREPDKTVCDHSQAEVYVGGVEVAYWLFDERYPYTVKVTAVKVNGMWKKLHYALPDRVVKIDASAGLEEHLCKSLNTWVETGELELLI